MILQDKFVYIRQIRDMALASSDAAYAALDHTEFVFYYNNGNVPRLIYNRDLTNQQHNTWARSAFKIYPEKKYLV